MPLFRKREMPPRQAELKAFDSALKALRHSVTVHPTWVQYTNIDGDPADRACRTLAAELAPSLTAALALHTLDVIQPMYDTQLRKAVKGQPLKARQPIADVFTQTYLYARQTAFDALA